MSSLIFWIGPVYGPGNTPYKPDGDIGSVDWLGVPTRIVTVSCQNPPGNGNPSCNNVGPPTLDALLASRGGGSVSDYDHVAVAGYSAGHNVMSPLLLADGDRIDAFVSIDACYSATNPPWTKAGYSSFAAKAAAGQKLCVFAATGSSHGGAAYPSSSGSECAGANFDAGVAAAGAAPVTIDSGLAVPPTYSERAGGLFLLDYALQKFSGQLPHFDIINKLSRDILQTYLASYLAGQPLPGGGALVPGSDSGAKPDYTVPIVVGSGLAIALALWWRSRRR